ncbi:MAG: aminoacyl--tRNA ligase-related protein, partial [Candidatus Dormibacteria bacterium]
MLSLNFIREHPELVLAGARRKGEPVPLDRILELDRQHRLTLHQEEEQRQLLNRRSQEVGKLARSGAAELERERSELGGLKASIQELQQRRRELQAELDQLLLLVPNPPHDSVPDGTADEENVVVRTWGERPRFDFTPLPHHELGERLGIFDFERAVKVAGTRFALLQGDGARLERALTSLMLDLARERGYREVSPPYMVNREAMVGTANLPKFEDEAFHVLEGDRFLIPTAEVPLTNLYAGEILEGERLPIRLCAWTPCWRSEAGAPGKDTHGYIRLHQFSKVELVKLSRPEDS